MKKQRIVNVTCRLLVWMDWMDEHKEEPEGLPDTLKAFIDLGKDPKYANIKDNFGLLRFSDWRDLVFNNDKFGTEKSEGAYIFLGLVAKYTDSQGEWIRCTEPKGWKRREVRKYVFKEENWRPIVDAASDADPDAPGDGTSPQKGDTPPD